MKLKRSLVEKKYGELIKDMYAGMRRRQTPPAQRRSAVGLRLTRLRGAGRARTGTLAWRMTAG